MVPKSLHCGLPMKLTQTELEYYDEAESGFCVVCNDVTIEGGISNYAVGLTCPACMQHTLISIEEALIARYILVVNEH